MDPSTRTPTATIVGLDRLRREDADTVGAKAANLGELAHAGFDVPDGFVTVGDAEDAMVGRAAAQLGDGPFAVRSSIAAEDLPGASFAGQYESLLGVPGADAVPAALHRVRASVETERVRRYQEELAGGSMGAIGVIVQRQVAADAAGVAFTANPVTGSADEVLVSSIRGLGERLVGGEADPDEWIVREGEVIAQRTPEGSLSEDRVLEVAAVARRVEAHFGFPVDVEWAFEGERLWLLQARPITALPTAVTPVPVPVEIPDGYWERDASHFPQPIAPMSRIFLDISSEALTDAFIDSGLPVDGAQFREIGGWTYLRIVPLGGKEPPALPAWLAPRVNALVSRVHPLFRRRIARLEEVERNDELIRTVDRWWAEDRAAYASRMRRLQDSPLPGLSDDELRHHFEETVRFCREAVTLHHVLHLADIIFPVRLALFCHDELGWPEQDVLVMLAGLSDASTEPGRALVELAASADERPAVRALLDEPDASAVGRLEAIDPVFAEAFHAYLHEFGCRALRYDVAEPTLAEVPEVALGLVRDQLVRGYDAAARAAAQRHQRDGMIALAREDLLARPAEVRERFDWLLERAERSYPVREDNEFYLVSAPLALLRYAALEIGRRLAARGHLDRPEDVFHLLVEEVPAALGDGEGLREIVVRRAGEVAWACAHPGPPAYGPEPRSPVLDGLPPLAQEYLRAITRGVELIFEAGLSGREQETQEGGFAGIPAAPGTYTGVVRVIRDETEFSKIRAGDVLVCPITSPVWSVLFASVGALVTDTGGVLSHAAIIAREYRIPAVVATGNATTLLRDGEIITVDGSAGTIRVVQPAASGS